MYALNSGEVRLCLMAANLVMTRGHTSLAERLFKAVLTQAEQIDGEGPLTGMVLLELHDLYYTQGRHDEAAPVWERMRRILIHGIYRRKTESK